MRVLAAGAAAALAVAFLPSTASAAVTSASCTTRSVYSHLWHGSGEDYADLYETYVGKAPASEVVAGSTWLCQPYNFQSDVQELIFTTTLGPEEGLNGSTLVSRSCGTLIVRRVNGSVVTSMGGPAPSQIQSNGRFTCDWHLSVSALTSGQTYTLDVVNQRMSYQWETGPHGDSYRFKIWLQVHSTVPDHALSQYFDVPVCFRTTPNLACSYLGEHGDPLGT